MSDREPHCPFLNRADHRCSSFFSLEQLQHAYEYCFHAYKTCGVYQELLVERQSKRSQAAGGGGGGAHASRFAWTTACVGYVSARANSHVSSSSTPSAAPVPFVQVRLPGGAYAGEQSAARI